MIGPTTRPPPSRRPDSAIRAARVHMIPGFVAIIVCTLFGCTGPRSARPAPPAGPTTIEAVGDWNDIGVAAAFGAGAGEAAIEDAQIDETVAIFSLRAVNGEPGVLDVTRAEEGDRVVASCTIGRFGDAVRQRRILEAFARRLQQLYGVDYAPIR